MCFSLPWLEQLCVWIVIVVALISALRVVIPWIASWAQLPAPVIAIINIIIWAVICIVAIYIIFDLLACLLGSGGVGLPRLR